MEESNVCYIKDAFFAKFQNYGRLMRNHDGAYHKRPHYIVRDERSKDIYWCVPLSSQIQKYDGEIKKEIARRIERNQPSECHTIEKGEFAGKANCFLVQNVFPITKKYIAGYSKHSIQQELKVKLDRSIKLTLTGQSHKFVDIRKIRTALLDEINSKRQYTARRSSAGTHFVSKSKNAQTTQTSEKPKPYEPTQPTRKSQNESISDVVQHVRKRQEDAADKRKAQSADIRKPELNKEHGDRGEETQKTDTEETTITRFSKEEWDDKVKALMPTRDEVETGIEAHRKRGEITK